MKSILKIMVAVFTITLISTGFSAVENVKVGGDIAIYGILRGDYYIDEGNEDLHFFQTHARVYVSADLSDNVSTMIRIINERDWGTEDYYSYNNYYYYDREIDLDLAYIKVTDLLAPGLILTVGRQEIELGEGLVVGSRFNAYAYDDTVLIAARDLGLRKAFDAIRLDYSATTAPLNLTAFYSKIYEAFIDDQGEKTLYGLNIGTKVAEILNLDVYYVRRAIDSVSEDTLDTAGIRIVSGVPAVEGLTLKGEYAKQFGDNGTNDYDGSALLLGAEYKFAANMEPKIKVNYVLLTGDDNPAGDIESWQMVYPSNIGSRIGPLLYAYSAYNNLSSLSSESNLQVINLGFSIKPVEKLSISLDGYLTELDEGTPNDIGTEISFSIDYAYTEDLSFGLTLGKILADDVIEYYGGDDAWQAIASMKVSF
ncbi:MAG: alginate export family protein [Candidatus Omnitrophica bacterium]|nr:alginate export family protein [Candidatus Omnitrophota bacterium]